MGRIKHKHLREPVMRFFVNHSFEETCRHFSLTKSELKSLMSRAYTDKALAHLRKDFRRKDRWSAQELAFLLSSVGLYSRGAVAQQLGRGNSQVIKEKLNSLKVQSKRLTGLPEAAFIDWFGIKPEEKLFSGRNSKYKIVEWDTIRILIETKKIECSSFIFIYVEAMAMFQEWLRRRENESNNNQKRRENEG